MKRNLPISLVQRTFFIFMEGKICDHSNHIIIQNYPKTSLFTRIYEKDPNTTIVAKLFVEFQFLNHCSLDQLIQVITRIARK
jgi:hypothetical protein